jgi:hypothetical protein
VIWLALLLVGVGLSDLVFSVRPMRHVPEIAAAGAVVVLGLLSGQTAVPELVALGVLSAWVVAWGQAVTRGFASGRERVPLAVLVSGVALALLLSPLADPAHGLVGDWLVETPVGVLQGRTTDEAVLLAGVLLVQLSTGNVLVRLVLAATRTVDPARRPGRQVPTFRLKGGRLLGPMERLFIVGLGVAGELTAASVVVAAKGLLRWPELQAAREERGPGSGIHAVTEYFLVGSFVSWSLALLGLVLLAG